MTAVWRAGYWRGMTDVMAVSSDATELTDGHVPRRLLPAIIHLGERPLPYDPVKLTDLQRAMCQQEGHLYSGRGALSANDNSRGAAALARPK